MLRAIITDPIITQIVPPIRDRSTGSHIKKLGVMYISQSRGSKVVEAMIM
jgi:hypothetical protein